MWRPIAVVAIWLVAAPSGSLVAGFDRRLHIQVTPRDGMYCAVLPQRGGGPPTFCVPGTTFKVSCNRCICRRSGMTAICTKKNCYKELDEECRSGEAMVVECNICICSPAGKWACTNKQCRSALQYIDCDKEPTPIGGPRTDVQQMCVPGTSFMNGCDRCYCTNDGISAVCRSRPCNGVVGTLIKLDSPVPEEGYPTIPPNVPIQNETHFCFLYGGTSLCANMDKSRALIGDMVRELNGNVIMEESEVFINETHACLSTIETEVCSPMEAILQLLAKLLSPDAPQSSNPTTPDFKNETHSCVFYQTQIICIGRDRIEDLEISCLIPGVRFGGGHVTQIQRDSPTNPGTPDFMNETHICFIYEGATIICFESSAYGNAVQRGGLRYQEMNCTPLTTFMDDCNVCWCDATGQVAFCTLIACRKRSTRDVSCTPGSTYKEQCNVCTCLQDGKSGSCTRKACLPGSY